MPEKSRELYQSLHFHTYNSDGHWTYQEVLNRCRYQRVGVVAFTDHDALPTPEDLKSLATLKNHPVKYLLGVELSAGHLQEVKEKIPTLHLVGLFVNPYAKDLSAYCHHKQAQRLQRAQDTTANLQKFGFAISWAEVKRRKEGLSIGLPHIVAALLDHPQNRVKIGKLIRELGREIRSGDPRRQNYEKMLSLPQLERQIYSLFLREDALIPGIYAPHKDTLDMDEAARLVRGAGGLAFLAHWSFSRPFLTEALVRKIAREKRVDGLEILYGLASGESAKDFKQDFAILRQVSSRYDLLQSGGGDIHNEKELRTFAQNPLSAGTQGMAEKIIERARPDLTWTSFER